MRCAIEDPHSRHAFGVFVLVMSLLCGLSTSAVAAKKPDLVEPSISNPPANRVQGQTFTVTDTAKNKGNKRAGKSKTGYYLSKNRSKSGSDVRLEGTRSVKALGPGAKSKGSKQVKIPLSTPVDSYFVLSCADDLKDINESDEKNNCKASNKKINVTLKDTTPPDPPTITDLSPTSPGMSTTVTVTGNAEPGTVKLYKSNDCSGPVADSDSHTAFGSSGLSTTVVENSTTPLTVNDTDGAGNVSGCSAAVEYENDTLAPAQPSITSTNPASPSNDNNPKIIGTAEAGSTVTVYKSNDCSSGVASGSAATFASPGIAAFVDPNSNNSFTVTAADTAGNTSPCSNPITYVEDSLAPSPPTIATSPVTPANDNAPEITGTAEAGSTVKVYKVESTQTNCPTDAQLIATGTASDYGTGGLSSSVPDNSTTLFRAQAMDAVGNVSACSATQMYVEDSPLTETEANNTSGTANPVNGVTPHLNGSIGSVGDVDYYSVTVPSGGNLRAETTGQFGSQTVCPGTTLTLYGTDGTTVLTSSASACSIIDGSGGINTSSPNPNANNMAAGTYFLKVEDTGNNATIPAYRVRVAIGNPLAASELEPNDTTGQADGNGIDFSGDDLRGGGLPVGDVDIFRVNLASPQVVRMETFDGSGTDCRGGGTLAMTMTLLDNLSNPLKTDTSESPASSGIGPCTAIVAELPTGISYIKVEEINNDGLIGQYRLQFEVLTDIGAESESNGTIGTADPIAGSNVVISGDHETANDTDVFSVAVAARQSIRAEIIEGNGNLIEACESNSMDTKITLTNASGDALEFDGRTGRTDCSLLDGSGLIPKDWGAHNLAAGTYYLRIESFTSTANAQNQFDYRLAVTVR